MVNSAVEAASGIEGRKLTPMLRQYVEAKQACPQAILMFRMGDFFELFFEDAKVAARELDLTLTARDKGEDPIPMAGVPHHAISGYIARLVDKGYTVALCDQVEDPKKAKGLVKREITRLITPGTVADLDALDPGSANFLACVDQAPQGGLTIALLDMLSGELLCTQTDFDTLGDELRRMGVRELLMPQALEAQVRGAVGDDERMAMRSLAGDPFSEDEARTLLRKRFGIDLVEGLEAGGTAADRQVLCQVIAFAETTQRRTLPHLMAPRAYRIHDYLVLDETTRRNLELCTSQLDNRRRGSLLWHLDRCRTAIGSRTLCQWLLFPLRDRQAIAARQDAVQMLREGRTAREAVQEGLDGVRDIERLLGRVAVGRATPRDLGALRDSLERLPNLKTLLASQSGPLAQRWRELDENGAVAGLTALLARALVPEPPISSAEGGIFARGFQDDLDELIALSCEGHDFLAQLEKRERERTGITSLKVRYNKVFGYYLEVTRANLAQVPKDFIRKQTLVGAERFITEELKDFEEKVLSADERRREREAELFVGLVLEVAKHTLGLRTVSRLVAETDVLASLAQVADEGRYVRPELCDEPLLNLREARHPVLERLMPGGERFVPNDVVLDATSRQLVIVTGPNMAGKSTVMRQAALCTVLAHMGSFVPAKKAQIGLCDRLFTRVGASDNLGRGQSTFMVEMMETATILRHATAQSLVLLDEIGRGTSTFDGVSLAWAVAEFMHDSVGCRAMFATHYHELTELAERRERIVNASVAVKEQKDRVVFLRRMVDGAANRSYGIEVARLAGVPEAVLGRARQILAGLEQSGKRQDKRQLSLFGALPAHAIAESAPAPAPAAAATPPPPAAATVAKELRAIDPHQMTPMQALTTLVRLREMLA